MSPLVSAAIFLANSPSPAKNSRSQGDEYWSSCLSKLVGLPFLLEQIEQRESDTGLPRENIEKGKSTDTAGNEIKPFAFCFLQKQKKKNERSYTVH